MASKLIRRLSSGRKIPSLEQVDLEVSKIIKLEDERQRHGLELIASENLTSKAVMQALGSGLTNKYSEGQPGKRYYGGNEYIDQLERLCQSRALQTFWLNPDHWHVNVQSLSGSPANFQVMTAVLNPGDPIMGLDLPCGGHLSHGYQTPKKKISAPAIYFNSQAYQTDPETGLIDYDQLFKKVQEHQPKLLICGGSAYPRDWDYAKFRQAADSVKAYLLADISHISGLVLTQEHNNPFEYCDFVTTTTHKTLRGPRGALIFCKQEYKDQIDLAVFPGCQGGPHNNVIAGIAVALHEASLPNFVNYIRQVKRNASHLANELTKLGYQIVTGGTDNHLILWDLRPQGLTGSKMEKICDLCHITINKNTVPGDKSALSPGGVRLGTPALTTRGFAEAEMERLALLLDRLVKLALKVQSKLFSKKLIDFVQALEAEEEELQRIRDEVSNWAKTYPLPS